MPGLVLAQLGRDALLYSPDPLAPDFGVRLGNNDNAPAYRTGDTVLVRHRRKGERIQAGADYIFARPSDRQGNQTVVLGHLTRATRTHWQIARYSANNRRLKRADWPTVYVVVGKYNTSNPALTEGART